MATTPRDAADVAAVSRSAAEMSATQRSAANTAAAIPSAIANPGPLGLSGFALTTFVLSIANAGLFPKTNDSLVVLGLAVFYGGLAQLLAGMWEFRSGNTFGATAFTSYGAFWLSFAALFLPGLGGAAALISNNALGVYLIGWAIVTGLLMLGALRTNGATAAVFILLFLTFLLLGIGKWANASGWTHLGGWVGILTAIAAWYTALAGILAGVSGGRIALPVFPLA
jgi:succinate-acetate transporter protein